MDESDLKGRIRDRVFALPLIRVFPRAHKEPSRRSQGHAGGVKYWEFLLPLSRALELGQLFTSSFPQVKGL